MGKVAISIWFFKIFARRSSSHTKKALVFHLNIFTSQDNFGALYLASGDHLSNLKFSRSRRSLLRYLAINELNFNNINCGFAIPNYKFLQVVLKIVSIKISLRAKENLKLKGWRSTFEIESSNLAFPPRITHPVEEVLVLRSAGRHGIELGDYSDNLEYSVRRVGIKNPIIVAGARIYPKVSNNFILQGIFNYFFDAIVEAAASNSHSRNFLNTMLPTWHLALTYIQLNSAPIVGNVLENIFYKSDLEHIINSDKKADLCDDRNNGQISNQLFKLLHIKNLEIRNGVNLIIDKHLCKLNSNEFYSRAKWPSLCWSSDTSSMVATPVSTKPAVLVEKLDFVLGSPNWHHFIEDAIPQLELITQQHPKDSNELAFGLSLDSIQQEMIRVLYKRNAFLADQHSRFQVGQLGCVYHNNSNRNSKLNQEGAEGHVEMNLMEAFAKRLYQIPSHQYSQKRKLFIRRGKNQFRKLIDERKVIDLLKANGFEIVDFTSLDFQSRFQLMQNAEVVILETGATAANIYLSSNLRVIELRNPGFISSNEHIPIAQVTNSSWNIILGKKIGIIQKLFFGSDSWKLGGPGLRELESQILEN